MGVYVYTIRRKFKTIDVNGQPVQAALVKYAFKDRSFPIKGFDDDWLRRTRLIVGRAEQAWADHTMPEYVVIGDNFEEGSTVKKDWPQGCVCAYDTPNLPGTLVGFLKKIGRGKYTVVDKV